MICCFENKQCYKVHILEHSLEVANYITTWCFSRENMTQKKVAEKGWNLFCPKKRFRSNQMRTKGWVVICSISQSKMMLITTVLLQLIEFPVVCLHLEIKIFGGTLWSHFSPVFTFHMKTSQLICTLNHDWFLYEMQHWAEMSLEKLQIPNLEYCNAKDYVYYLLYLPQEVKPSKNENQRPTSANASSPDKSNRFTFNIWLSTWTLVTPKSTPIVGKYLLTKRFSQYLLIKHVLPVCVSPRLMTFTRVVFLSALMIWRERPLISWLLGSETHCARFLSSFYLRRKKG